MNQDYLKAELLLKLYRRGIWGGRHTPLKSLFHMIGEADIKESKKAAKELVNLKWILIKKSTNEEHVSLNPKAKSEIKNYIIKILGIDPNMLK